MRKTITCFMLALVFGWGLNTKAATPKRDSSARKTVANIRSPNQVVEPGMISINVVFGEKTTSFIILKSKTGAVVGFSNNAGETRSTEVSKDDYAFITDKINKISGTTNQKSFCNRNYIEVETDARNLVGCLGSTNKVAEELQRVTNLLTLLF